MQPVTCPGREQLSLFLQGRLLPESASSIEAHVDSCAHCQEEFRSLEASGDLLLDTLRRSGETEVTVDSHCEQAIVRIAALEPNTDGSPVAASAANEELGSVGFYKLLSKLGEGGMGAVYKAQHTRLRRTVAIKVLPVDRIQSAEAIARFDREMQAVGALDHENIVRAFDAGDHNGRHYIAMEYVKGRDVSQIVRAAGPLPVADACEIIRQAAIGLQHAHEAGLVHRDIKPGNLMLTEAGVVKVLDLGLARIGQTEAGGELTTTGQVMGTLDYMAPEQGGDTHRVDIRADIYSLGASLYKLLTGEAPFGDPKYDTPLKKMVALATAEPVPLKERRPDVSPQLSAIVQRMLAKTSDQRQKTPSEVVADLAPFAKGSNLAALVARVGKPPGTGVEDTLASIKSASVDTHSPIPLPAPVAVRNRQNPPFTWLLIGAGGLAVLLLGILLYWSSNGATVRIEVADGTKVSFDESQLTLERKDQKPIQLQVVRNPKGDGQIAAGEKHRLRVKCGDFEFETDLFELKVKGETVIKISLVKPDEIRVDKDGNIVAARLLEKRNAVAVEASGTAGDAQSPPLAIAPFSTSRARELQQAWAKHLGVPVEHENSIGMKFVLIPPGEFTMGSTQEEIEAALADLPDTELEQWKRDQTASESPRHKVILTKPIYLGVHEVTQGQFERMMGRNPSFYSKQGTNEELVQRVAGMDTSRHPVDGMNRDDVIGFCAALSRKEELKPVYSRSGAADPTASGYCLPTEAQWEFACRAGSTTRCWLGDMDEDMARVGWLTHNSDHRTHEVGTLDANPFGLFDMHGNVSEWLQDWWDAKYYEQFRDKPAIDPTGPTTGERPCSRGGSCLSMPSHARAGSRQSDFPTINSYTLGFRVALSVEGVKAAKAAASKQVRAFTVREACEFIFSHQHGVTLADGTSYADSKSLPAGDLKVVLIGLGGSSNPPYETTDEDLARLRCLSDLQLAFLWRTKVTTKGLVTLSEFAPDLQHLLIESPELDDKSAEVFARWPKLSWLEIGAPRLTHTGLKHLASMPALTSLELRETRLSAADLQLFAPQLHSLGVGGAGPPRNWFERGALEELKNFGRLRIFRSNSGQIRDDDLLLICQIPRLEKLVLGNQLITGRGLATISQVKNLNVLVLDANEGISDDGLQHLAALPELVNLNLSQTAITDNGLKTLATNKKLKLLNVQYCPGVTQAGIDAFHAAVPGCKIDWNKGEVPAEEVP